MAQEEGTPHLPHAIGDLAIRWQGRDWKEEAVGVGSSEFLKKEAVDLG